MTMRALKLVQIGARQKIPYASALKLAEVPLPTIADGECLVKVAACGLNNSDVKIPFGFFPYAQLDRILGRDGAGTVVDGPQELVGKRVFWSSGKDGGMTSDGALAEYVVIAAQSLVEVPAGISLAEAGSMGVPLVTAATAIRKADPQPGETLAVVGANGQVGRFALLLGRLRGCKTVWIVRRAFDKLEGADEVVDISVDSALEKMPTPDVVIDTVGVAPERWVDALGHSGRLVLLAAPMGGEVFPCNVRTFYRKNLTIHSTETMQYTRDACAQLMRPFLDSFRSRALTPPAVDDHVFTLEDAEEAFAVVDKGTTKRVIVAPNGKEALEA
eukprot:TRINITY_DN62926_c0_g1_i1.p1 TRINITY_DN62926_c0_g1~~TRINITY_DN62926_c0_g1_i1.p1  ORF type:complete len:330 (+),score=59.33 TRINITY_DN62926_c0_g1_i1:31-1020(+)